MSQTSDGTAPDGPQRRPPADRRRLLAGGVGLIAAVLGFTATQAAIGALGLPDVYVLFAMPAFGIVGFVSLAVFVTAFVPPEETDQEPDPAANGTGTE